MAEPHLERLLAELGERAGAEIAQVRADAESEASELLLAANRRIAAHRQDALTTCEADYARRRASAAGDARTAARGDLLRAQHALVDLVIGRARTMLAERLERERHSSSVDARVAELQSFVPNGVVTRRDGLQLVANDGKILIDDTIDAWLEGERARIAIEVCRVVETL
jgi:vacuolar-type H+-ATPase subunit E/Vma4